MKTYLLEKGAQKQRADRDDSLQDCEPSSNGWQDAQDRALEYLRRLGIGPPESLRLALEALSRAADERDDSGRHTFESMRALRSLLDEILHSGCESVGGGRQGASLLGLMMGPGRTEVPVTPPIRRGAMPCAELGPTLKRPNEKKTRG
jgi:hypothetical protein